MTLAAVLALSSLVGVALGALGGGGSILTVPILIYVAELEAKQAIATSLLVVGATSVAGAVAHARAGQIRWRTGLLFGVGGMVGAFGGGLLGGSIPGRVLLVGFALMMLATSVAMLRGRRTEHAHTRGDLAVLPALLEGVVVGLVTGLVGAGGGFLVVPALALFGGLPITAAVGTSLVVIAMKSFAGLAGYLTTVSIPWHLAIGVTVAAILGSVLGSWLSGRIPEARLRRVFGWFVLVTGTFVLLEQAAPQSWLAPGLAVLAVAVLAVGGRRMWRSAHAGGG